jgi:phage baseplate assembly protein gpV
MSDRYKGLRDIYDAIDESSNKVTHIAEALVKKVRKKDKKVLLHLLPDMEEIGWVRLYMLNANNAYSSGQLPEVDTTVLVLFPRGDTDNAICLSGGYCEANELGFPLEADYDLVLSDKYGNKFVMAENKITLQQKTSSGSKIVIDSGKITIEAESGKDIDIKASNVNINATAGSTKISGATTVEVNAPLIKLNNGTLPIARITDIVATPMGPGSITGPGNPTVLA